MSFPISPSNNQIALVNGIEYYYLSTKGAWYRYGDGSANVITSNTFQVLSSLIFSDGTSQTSAASPTDSYARTTANTATDNIVILQGVNTDQNTRITIAEGVDTSQNTRLSIIEGVDATQNTNISAVDAYATGAYGKANTGTLLAQAAFDYANTILSLDSNIDTLARTIANTATDNITIIQGVDTTQNTNITNASNAATGAFDKANAAYELANTANTTASSGGGGSSSTSFTSVVDTFTGNGSQTEFTLSVSPDAETSTFVYLNGQYQNKSTYSLSGANVIFTGVATSSDTIEVVTVAGSVMNVSPSGYSTRIYQGDGTTDTFTVTAGQTANTVMVFNNGICQFPGDDYTVSGTTLTYVIAPESDETVQIREMPINQLVAVTQPYMRRYTANGVQTTFTVTSGQSANSMFVYENGVCQMPVNDYTVSGTILTFTTAPTADKVIQIREMPV